MQEDMRHLRLSFDIVWQWKNIGLSDHRSDGTMK